MLDLPILRLVPWQVQLEMRVLHARRRRGLAAPIEDDQPTRDFEVGQHVRGRWRRQDPTNWGRGMCRPRTYGHCCPPIPVYLVSAVLVRPLFVGPQAAIYLVAHGAAS